MKRLAAALLLPLVLLAARPAVAVDADQARILVSSAAHDSLAAFGGKKQTPTEAQAVLHHILTRYSDMDTVSLYLLGRYWSRASPEARHEFSGLLEGFLITAFGGLIKDMAADDRIEIKGAEAKGDKVVVHSLFLATGEDPTPVDWVVGDTGAGRPVIVDLSVDGVTVVTTMQADFTSVIRSASGKLEALFEPLRRKINSLDG